MKIKFNRKAVISAFLIICAVIYSYLLFNVVSKQDDYRPEYSDAILVLGHSLDESELPDQWLVERLSLAKEAYLSGYGEYIIVSGGDGYSYKKSVASAMREWLLQNGVPKEIIILEENASNTTENFLYAKKEAESVNLDINSIIAVTNDFHIYRSMLIGKNYFDRISGYSSAVGMDFHKFLAYAKEPLSIIKFYIFDRFLH